MRTSRSIRKIRSPKFKRKTRSHEKSRTKNESSEIKLKYLIKKDRYKLFDVNDQELIIKKLNDIKGSKLKGEFLDYVIYLKEEKKEELEFQKIIQSEQLLRKFFGKVKNSIQKRKLSAFNAHFFDGIKAFTHLVQKKNVNDKRSTDNVAKSSKLMDLINNSGNKNKLLGKKFVEVIKSMTRKRKPKTHTFIPKSNDKSLIRPENLIQIRKKNLAPLDLKKSFDMSLDSKSKSTDILKLKTSPRSKNNSPDILKKHKSHLFRKPLQPLRLDSPKQRSENQSPTNIGRRRPSLNMLINIWKSYMNTERDNRFVNMNSPILNRKKKKTVHLRQEDKRKSDLKKQNRILQQRNKVKKFRFKRRYKGKMILGTRIDNKEFIDNMMQSSSNINSKRQSSKKSQKNASTNKFLTMNTLPNLENDLTAKHYMLQSIYPQIDRQRKNNLNFQNAQSAIISKMNKHLTPRRLNNLLSVSSQYLDKFM